MKKAIADDVRRSNWQRRVGGVGAETQRVRQDGRVRSGWIDVYFVVLDNGIRDRGHGQTGFVPRVDGRLCGHASEKAKVKERGKRMW